jgi:hypothetical protein
MAKTKARADRFESGLSSYDDLVVEGQTLELNVRGRVVLSRFKASDCEIVIREGVEPLLVDAEFSRCRIRSASSRSATADAARFDACIFQGVFEGWVFGGRLEAESLRDCDFRAADLNDCELNCCELATQKFPGWPTLVFVEPAAHQQLLLNAQWPQTTEARIWMQTLLRTRRFPTAGVVVNAEKAARWMQVDSARLRSVVDTLPGVILA